MEPVLRSSNMLSFDISALANAFAPANRLSPNGLHGDEACQIMRFAGMSPMISSIGIFGYLPQYDQNDLTAKQISQMMWYILDGRSRGRREASLDEKDSFNEFHIAFAEGGNHFFYKAKKPAAGGCNCPIKKFIRL
ncbi:MAG: arginase family protein [Chitinophagaceae bacterium]|nr:arginase family protein [Chitinophagaceae bacterium]